MSASPTVAQWQLATELRRLRGDAKLSDVAKAIRVYTSTVSRWETPGVEGVIPGPGSLERILEFYGTPAPEVDRFLLLRKEARTSGWWQTSGVAEDYGTFIGMETEARRIRTFESVLVPGLLQTEDYVRALFAGTMPEASEDRVDAAVSVRMSRQDRWNERANHLSVIVNEAVVRTVVGGPQVMASQTRHLVHCADRPDMSLLVLPFNVGAHAALEIGNFTILTLSELSVLVTVNESTNLFWDDKDSLERHSKVFERLLADSWRPAESRAFLDRIAQEYEKG